MCTYMEINAKMSVISSREQGASGEQGGCTVYDIDIKRVHAKEGRYYIPIACKSPSAALQ